MKTIYLVRHGEINSGKPRKYIGRTDLPLTLYGRAQMRTLGFLLSRCSAFDQITCSPLCRCQESSEILNASLKINSNTEPDLAEINLGDWEGLTVQEVRTKFPGEFEARGEDLSGFVVRKGESFQNLLDRVWPAFNDIIDSTETASVVVAHAGVNRVLLCHILGLPLESMFRFQQNYGCYNILYASEDQIRIGSLNCTAL